MSVFDFFMSFKEYLYFSYEGERSMQSDFKRPKQTQTHTYTHTHTHTHTHIYIYIYIYICSVVCDHVWLSENTCACVYANISVRVNACVLTLCVSLVVCVYVCWCMCVYMFIYSSINAYRLGYLCMYTNYQVLLKKYVRTSDHMNSYHDSHSHIYIYTPLPP